MTTAPLRPRYADESEFEGWLRAVEERIGPFMAWLGVVFALLVVLEVAGDDLAPGTRGAIRVAGWVIWVVFLADFAVRLRLAPNRLTFLRRNVLTVVALAVPFLRVLAFLRLARVGRVLPVARALTSGYRAVGTARVLLRSRLGYLAGIASVSVLAVAEVGYLSEQGRAEPAFTSFGDALLWAAAVVLGLQGDPVPPSTGAHLAMIGGFMVGLVIVAALAGALGAFLLESHGERAAAGRGTGVAGGPR
jgi:voltage-gated potassium channel